MRGARIGGRLADGRDGGDAAVGRHRRCRAGVAAGTLRPHALHRDRVLDLMRRVERTWLVRQIVPVPTACHVDRERIGRSRRVLRPASRAGPRT